MIDGQIFPEDDTIKRLYLFWGRHGVSHAALVAASNCRQSQKGREVEKLNKALLELKRALMI